MMHATAFSTFARFLRAGAVLALLSAIPAQAQLQKEEPDAEDIARTPLQDFNIDREGIPAVLSEAAKSPYATEGLANCDTLVGEIARLDRALGADFDIADDEKQGGLTQGGVAKSVVGSFIPFRGIVREVSGANDRQREINLALTAGMVRRGFLKGIGLQRGCDYPARPSPAAPEG